MRCTDLEILLCDYVDGALSPAEKATVELHLGECESCRTLVEDASAAVGFMERAAEVEPPPALINKILFETTRQGTDATTKRNPGIRGWLGRLFEPILQPRFAMGMAMTILSFSMLGRFAGVPVRQLKASDLDPARVMATVEDKAWRTWERAKKYYESLRVVYEMQQTLSDWSQNDGAATGTGSARPAAPVEEGPIQKAPQGEKSNLTKDGRQPK